MSMRVKELRARIGFIHLHQTFRSTKLAGRKLNEAKVKEKKQQQMSAESVDKLQGEKLAKKTCLGQVEEKKHGHLRNRSA